MQNIIVDRIRYLHMKTHARTHFKENDQRNECGFSYYILQLFGKQWWKKLAINNINIKQNKTFRKLLPH